ncbi:HEAT repeat domain-containing protein [Pendulispora albinea]|uniref:HEAT repeat domain-containing protein n=1 Tax=Pendulispora albinea TaxID=2741071 RepID=A0ABZ2M7H3_9BACT
MNASSRNGLTLSPEDRVRVERVESLVRKGAEAIPSLLEMLADPSWVVRRAVTAALARAGDPAIPGLVRILRARDANEALLAAAVDALASSVGNVTEPLLALTDETEKPATICDVLQVLGRRKATGATARIAALTTHANDNVGISAIEALGRIGGAETVEPLVAAVGRNSFFRTFPAIDALGRTGDPRAIAPLVALLGDPLYAVEAIRALGRTGQSAAVTRLGELVPRSSDAVLRAIAVALIDLVELHETRFGITDDLMERLRELVSVGASVKIRGALVGALASERNAMARVLGWLGDETAILGLLELLDDDSTRATASTALRGLGSSATPYLLQAIRDGDSVTRERLLPLVGHGRVGTEEFASCLTDREPEVRALACEALARLGNTSVVPLIFRLIADSNPRVSQAASAAIHSLGSQETKSLALDEARSPDVRVRRAALRILGYFGYPEGLPILIAAMNDEDERIRESATSGLPLIDDPRALEALIAGTSHPTAKTRAAATRALGQTSAKPEVTASLTQRLEDEDAWVRYYACQALARLKVNAVTERIVSLLDDEAGQVRVAAVEALAQLGNDRAIAALSEAATSNDPDIRRAALTGLGIARHPQALPLIRSALTSSDSATRLVAVAALAEFDVPDVVPLLASAAMDPDEQVRSSAIGFLSTRPGPGATHALIERLADVGTRERVIAALAVAPDQRTEGILAALETADEETCPLLVSALVRMRRAIGIAAVADVLNSQNVLARRAAAAAIASIHTKEMAHTLKRALSDPDHEVRRIAFMAKR